MRKKQLFRELKKQYNISKSRSKSYDWDLDYNDNKFQIKVIKCSESTQITINSKHVWNLQQGKQRGIRFVVKSNKLLFMKQFLQEQNPIIICLNKPYKVLKYINESEVVNVSNETEIHDIPFFISTNKLDDFINKQT